MLLAGEVKGELARIHPARTCCRRAELAGLLYGDRVANGGVRTLDHATARTAMHLATSIGLRATTPPGSASGQPGSVRARHHLEVWLEPDAPRPWHWSESAACDRRSFLRGVMLGNASLSLGARGPHIEFVFRHARDAAALQRRLAECGVSAARLLRRDRQVVYLKGQEEVATLLRLVGANRALLDFETARVGRDVRNRVNRLLNAEEANLGRTVRAADRQLQAIAELASTGRLESLPRGLREAAAQRRAHPDADLDALATGLGISRSAANHRLRRLVDLADDAA
ncbi:MAG: DNA-binding protein WhiA [Chloroflexota bacterium]|nr:DNA-binding protein WhiA [Chloroflexota bacterium]